MQITVLVPTYKRPEDLARCLAALRQQQRPANEVLVTVRDCDAATWNFLDKFSSHGLPLRLLKLDQPGQVFALNSGLIAAKGDIICITDDDAAPHIDWLERIEVHFQSNSSVGAVGGRDWVHQDQTVDRTEARVVGKLQWFGRVIGNHHRGTGEAREVDLLKGANMSYRALAVQSLTFDNRLKGHGAQACNDMAFSLAVRKAGWKVIYDPAVAVDHYPAQRFDQDQRDQFVPEAWENSVHSETVSLLPHLKLWQKAIFIVWSITIGTRRSLGLLQLARLSLLKEKFVIDKYTASTKGLVLGWSTYLTSSEK